MNEQIAWVTCDPDVDGDLSQRTTTDRFTKNAVLSERRLWQHPTALYPMKFLTPMKKMGMVGEMP